MPITEENEIMTIVQSDDTESLVEFGLSKEEKLIAIKYAIDFGSTNILKLLLRQVDPRDSKDNLLFIASQKRNSTAVKELCAHHAWNHKAIDDAYKHALKNQSFDIVNTLYFATGHWSNVER